MGGGVVLFIDTSKCIGCKACQVACKQWHSLPANMGTDVTFTGDYTNPPDFDGNNLTYVKFVERDDIEGMYGEQLQFLFFKNQCRHCVNPQCKTACPQGVKKTKEGFVIFTERCTPANVKKKYITGKAGTGSSVTTLVDSLSRSFEKMGVRTGMTVECMKRDAQNKPVKTSGTITAIEGSRLTCQLIDSNQLPYNWAPGDKYKIIIDGLQLACPFGVPRLNATLGRYVKCDFCYDRFSFKYPSTYRDGKPTTACELACPTGAIQTIQYNSSKELFGGGGIIRTRLREVKTKMYPRATLITSYGSRRFNVIWLLIDEPSKYGLKEYMSF